MKTFTVLLQTGADEFEVMTFQGESSKSIYPLYREFGIAVHIEEKTETSEEFCIGLAERMIGEIPQL